MILLGTIFSFPCMLWDFAIALIDLKRDFKQNNLHVITINFLNYWSTVFYTPEGGNYLNVFPWMEIFVSPRFPREESLKTNLSFFPSSSSSSSLCKDQEKRPSELSSNLTSSKTFFYLQKYFAPHHHVVCCIKTLTEWKRREEREKLEDKK